MKKIKNTVVTILTLLLFPVIVFSQSQTLLNNEDSLINTDYVRNLRIVGFPIDEILQKKSISRYDITRLLNAVECIDCLNPGQEIIDSYTQSFWGQFISRPGEDFRDILYRQAFYREGSYYYCVAYAADNEYMNGYPINTSPICGGNFCGTKDTTKAEFLQIIMNVIEQYTYQKYSINRSEVQDRRSNIAAGTYTDRYFNSFDDETIAKGVARCGDTSCVLSDRWDFKTYRKYCTFELKKCNNQEFGYLKAGWWPVAELNVLKKEGILQEDNIQETIHDPVDGEYAIRILGRLFPIIQCTFNNDYDCDGISNNRDSCPNTYNPTQRDLDQDGIGNSCDDDIDGDSITNPIGIVDDNDSVIISKYNEGMDNCLFIQNTDQLDSNKDKIGDVCDNTNEYVSLRIEPIIKKENGPLSIGLRAVTEGNAFDIERDLGDGIQKKGETIIHTYNKPGTYTIIAKAKGFRNDAIAKTTIIIGDDQKNMYGLALQSSQLYSQDNKSSFNIQNITTGDISNTTITILTNNTGAKNIQAGEVYTKTFTENGNYQITASRKKNNDIIAVSQNNVGIGENGIGSALETKALVYETDEEVEFKTLLEGNISSNQVKEIQRDFGDGEKTNSNKLLYKKTYEKGGRFVVKQNIVFEDNTSQQNFITIYVIDKNKNESNENIYIQATPGITAGNKKTDFIIHPFQINEDNIIKKIINFGTEQTQIIDENEASFEYTKPGTYYPLVTYHLNECKVFNASATIVVKPSNACLEAIILGTLDQYKCDADKDTIPDICDNDIDGDGRENQIGLVKFEKDDCSFEADNIEKDILQEHIDGICSLDNCPFISNSDQIDLNQDGIGDICPELLPYSKESSDLSEVDTDGDGLTDDRDACPELPENYNNVEDIDGCPEIGNNDPCIGDLEIPSNAFITALNCNSCPCHFADFGGTLSQGDKIRAILTNPIGTIDYTRTFSRIIE